MRARNRANGGIREAQLGVDRVGPGLVRRDPLNCRFGALEFGASRPNSVTLNGNSSFVLRMIVALWRS